MADALTHTWELETEKLGFLEGEMSFNGPNNQPPRITLTTPLDATLEEYKEVGVVFKEVVDLYKCAGEIKKFEILKKP